MGQREKSAQGFEAFRRKGAVAPSGVLPEHKGLA
jgi:hypothetical protein